MMIVALLSLLGDCGLNQIGNRFTIDNMVVKQSFWHQRGLPQWSGTGCRLWVKHGSNPAVSQDGMDDAPGPQRTTINLLHFNFLPTYQVYKHQSTYLWTSCGDALLIDWMQLRATDGGKNWGSDNAYAWCLSTDEDDGESFNEESDRVWDGWNVISDGICYSTLKLEGNGDVWGWTGWRPTYWQGRRMLEAMEDANLPSAADVDACVDDESRPAEECDNLVDQILSFQIEHQEGFVRAVELPISDEDRADSDVSNTNTQAATDDRRVLSALRRLLKA